MATVYQISHNIISNLGFSSEENYNSVYNGLSGLVSYPTNTMNIPEAFCASIIDENKLNMEFSNIGNRNNYSRFDKMTILSAYSAIRKTNIDPSSQRTQFILSTTKGNIDLLENAEAKSSNDKQLFLWNSARLLSQYFENPNTPLVVSNACISGVSAQIVAKRLLLTGKYDHIVVVGADIVSKFVVTGFQSFKALSAEKCLPFDSERKGLNIGEAAATIIYGVSEDVSSLDSNALYIDAEAITNDANHISGPSRTAEGLTLAIKNLNMTTMPDFICAHGTATPYNDDMEALALTRCELNKIPTFSLKGYFGHSLGATGVVETIIASLAMQNNVVFKSMGYNKCGVSNPIQISTETQKLESKSFLKTISGFGGCNAAILIKNIEQIANA